MNQKAQLASWCLPIGSIDAYINRVNQIPLLSIEEEVSSAKLFRDTGDLEAARRLVLAHLRYVVRVARGYLGYGLPLSDLIQEGNIGLMKAIKRFDPNIGVRLVSFAIHWIKSEIHEFVLRNWRIVKIATTKAQRKLFFNLRKIKTGLGWCSNEKVDAIAQDLGVSRKDVFLMDERLNARDSSYDAPVYDNEDDTAKAPEQYLYDSDNDPAYLLEKETCGDHNREQLFLALEQLDKRSQDILQQRWLADNKTTLHDLADKYGVSAERVRQLEKNAMEKLRQQIKPAVGKKS